MYTYALLVRFLTVAQPVAGARLSFRFRWVHTSAVANLYTRSTDTAFFLHAQSSRSFEYAFIDYLFNSLRFLRLQFTACFLLLCLWFKAFVARWCCFCRPACFILRRLCSQSQHLSVIFQVSAPISKSDPCVAIRMVRRNALRRFQLFSDAYSQIWRLNVETTLSLRPLYGVLARLVVLHIYMAFGFFRFSHWACFHF